MKFLLSLSLKVKIIIISCTVAAAAAVTGAVIVLNSEEAYRVIKVFELEGSAVVSRENAGELDAYVGMNLESGDVLSVNESSVMRISLDGDKYILLDGGTVLELAAKGSASDGRTTLSLKEGTILNEITNALSANSSYEVNTPKATMAVRGTSFSVTVRKLPPTEDNGGQNVGYLTDIDTIHGTVAVRLFDESGNPKGEEALVTAGNRATISVDPNDKTGNSPEIDGNAYFVFRKDGGIVECGEEDPVYPSDYSTLSYAVKSEALGSNDSGMLVLDNEIAAKLRGEDTGSGEAETSDTSETTSEAQTSSETSLETPSLTTTEELTSEAVTTAPTELPVSEMTFSETAAVTTAPPVTEADEPETVIPSEITSAPETEPTQEEIFDPDPAHYTESSAEDTEETTEKTTASTTERRTEAATLPFYPYVPPAYTTPAYTTPAYTFPITTPTTVSETNTESETVSSDILPAVHNVSFVDAGGNVLSSAEIEDGGSVGALPAIAEKRGYTGRWVCEGTPVTSSTVVSSDMNITAQYTPRTVRLEIIAPHSGDPLNSYTTVKELTVSYDSPISRNSENQTIASLTTYVESLYADYFEQYGERARLGSVTINTGLGSTATDSLIVTGDNVREDINGELYIIICFNYVRT